MTTEFLPVDFGRVLLFNTGRGYSPSGQRIAAYPLACPNDPGTHWVAFVDIDRGIDGICKADMTERDIMERYDAGEYRWHGSAPAYVAAQHDLPAISKMLEAFAGCMP